MYIFLKNVINLYPVPSKLFLIISLFQGLHFGEFNKNIVMF